MAKPSATFSSSANPFQYAVPVTIESFSKGFVAHKFWARRHWIPQLRAFRRALYSVHDTHSPHLRLARRLPAEIINIIVRDVKKAAVEQGFRDCEQRMGVLKTSASLEIEKGLAAVQKYGQGRVTEAFFGKFEQDTLTSYMMKTFSLAVMPGMSPDRQDLTHLFLCFTTDSESQLPVRIEHWDPAEHPYPPLSNEKSRSAPRTTRPIFRRYGASWRQFAVSQNVVLDNEFVEQALHGKSAIGKP